MHQTAECKSNTTLRSGPDRDSEPDLTGTDRVDFLVQLEGKTTRSPHPTVAPTPAPPSFWPASPTPPGERRLQTAARKRVLCPQGFRRSKARTRARPVGPLTDLQPTSPDPPSGRSTTLKSAQANRKSESAPPGHHFVDQPAKTGKGRRSTEGSTRAGPGDQGGLWNPPPGVPRPGRPQHPRRKIPYLRRIDGPKEDVRGGVPDEADQNGWNMVGGSSGANGAHRYGLLRNRPLHLRGGPKRNRIARGSVGPLRGLIREGGSEHQTKHIGPRHLRRNGPISARADPT